MILSLSDEFISDFRRRMNASMHEAIMQDLYIGLCIDMALYLEAE